MTFEETFASVMGTELLKLFNPEQLEMFRMVTLTFYKCGEQQGAINVARIVEAAAKEREAHFAKVAKH